MKHFQICEIYNFEDNYNIARSHFETDSLNVMKNKSFVTKKQRKYIINIFIL